MKNLLHEIDLLQEEINTKRPFEKTVLGQIKEYYKIGLTYSSNALEGNSLTETETKIVIEEGITIGGKRLIEHLEAVGHSQAYDFMYDLTKKNNFNEEDIKRLHHLFYQKIDELQSGVYRKVNAVITGSKYPLPNPDKIDFLMQEFIGHLDQFKSKYHPVEFAALVHKQFVFIHPFVDGNGRVSRLIMNLALLQAGYNIAIIPPILRRDYINALELAHIDDKTFIKFIANIVKETQKDYIRLFIKK